MTLLSPVSAPAVTDRVTFTDLLTHDHARRALLADVRRGLTGRPKMLPPTWFYDQTGSELFEAITRLPEYYVTRTEDAILRRHGAQIARVTRARTVLELGSGSSAKTRRILTALRSSLESVVSIDVSTSALTQAAAHLSEAYPAVRVHAVRADFTTPIKLPDLLGAHPRLLMFLGSTLGNFDVDQRGAFLGRVRAMLQPGDWFLLGVDLIKDGAVLQRAYDDAAGVTAQFNLNLLCVLNRELGARFDPSAFDHVALWDPAARRIEMRLRATRALRVAIPGAGIVAQFDRGEELLTEISCKFDLPSITAELSAAGLDTRYVWSDPHAYFAVLLCRADQSLPQQRPTAPDSEG